MKCSNCENFIDKLTICNVCGMEVNTIAIGIENRYRKMYPSFSQKSGKHDPYTYCKKWLLQLQGKEDVNISSENFNRIAKEAHIWLNQNNNADLSCDIIRKWLKDLSLSRYNPHTTWLRIHIESTYNIKGYSYDLSKEEVATVLDCISEIRREFANGNLPYYPYIIMRILSTVIQDKNRLDILLSNAHFQNKVTLDKSECIWKELCNKLRYDYVPLSIP